MPGGRARGNPVQIFSENLQNFPSTDLKNILYFDIPMNPSFICHTKFGHSPHGLDFGIFGPLWVKCMEFEHTYDLTYVLMRTFALTNNKLSFDSLNIGKNCCMFEINFCDIIEGYYLIQKRSA